MLLTKTPLCQASMMLPHEQTSMPYLTVLGSSADKVNSATSFQRENLLEDSAGNRKEHINQILHGKVVTM